MRSTGAAGNAGFEINVVHGRPVNLVVGRLPETADSLTVDK